MIKTKRNSLEKFIRTQMEGPGACHNRFDFIGDVGNEVEIVDVVNTTPGSLYSTAVLFPKRILKQDSSHLHVEEAPVGEEEFLDIEDAQTSETNGESDTDADIEEKNSAMSLSEEDDLYSLSQRFPNTIGISCCLDTKGRNINGKDLKITISGRYYTKISKDKSANVLILINENYHQFESFFNENKEKLSPYFSLKANGVCSVGSFSKEFAQIKKILLEINLKISEQIAKDYNGESDKTFVSIGGSYRYLKSYKERLWAKLRQLKEGEEYLTDQEKQYIVKRIEKIELYETFLSYLEDVANIHNSKSFGYWTAQYFTKEVDLSNIDLNSRSNKQIFSPNKFESLNNIISFDVDRLVQASLSVWLQITTNSREGNSHKRYLKVQLQNTSTPFEEDTKHYFSIVTEKVNQRCFFGVEIKVESDLLCPYHHSSKNTDINDDIDQLNFLYSSIKDYGIGHLCSVDWTINNDNKFVKSEFIPSFETPDVEPIPRDKYSDYVLEGNKIVPKQLLEDTKALEFKWLSTFSSASNEDIITKLLVFVEAYSSWIERLKTIENNDSEFAIQNLLLCECDYKRMKRNIQLLLNNNPVNIESFRLMNSAMFIQLWHNKNSTNEKTTPDFYKNANDHLFGDSPATWRPFQIAFILLNLDGILQRPDDPEWKNRNELVDLVWFPTGGGKTEAYLGIIALTIINRRRNEDQDKNGGTTAIMRYTLRLLATQQFQRAMRVILALEQLRMWNDTKLGEETISIGLYVGKDSLPNSATDLLSECRKWSDFTGAKRVESKIPLDKCPWCGEFLEFQNMGTERKPEIKFQCKNVYCTFSEELPVILCDEYIYQTPPTLLFGTVDKFAAIGHNVATNAVNKDSRRIFGKGQLNNLPPDLIIQDELHLLLGPLGSAVSLFECAIDQLCSYKKQLPDGKEISVRPKIISSTATTRNTELQIRALYDRDVNIFPKNGIDYDDSFFAFFKREKVDNQVKFVSKRKYMGILPTGRTQMTTQMRLIATMFVHRALFEKENAERIKENEVEKAMDFYHSIIAYFNSLKEVGKTDAQFYTEFTKYTRRLFKRVLRNSNMLECYYGYDSSFSKSELTGRLSGAEVVDQLAVVAKHWKSEKRLPHIDESGKIWQRGETPPDLILATNMISVGLDVDRFNTIVMNSMPRNIAEYIQASSRVARNEIGLVVTLHNPFRSRDLSHFEKFREFHEKLYYYVEPISITPFSKKSVEKYLPLYLATMIRHSYEQFADQTSAGLLNAESASKIRKELIKYFEERLERTKVLSESQNNLLTQELETNIELFVGQALEQWIALANAQQAEKYVLRYSGSDFLNKNKRIDIKYKDLFLALDAYEDENSQTLWSVPMSLRNVESEAVISINER